MTHSHRAHAFTLLEVLLAIGLIGILSGSLFTFLWQVSAQKTAVTQRAMDDQSADAVIERLETALTGTIAADSSGAAGVLGTSTSLKVLSRGVALPIKPTRGRPKAASPRTRPGACIRRTRASRSAHGRAGIPCAGH